MIENVQRCGGVAVVVDDRWGTPVDPQKVEDALKANSGRQDPGLRARRDLDRRAIRREDASPALARKHGALTIMDAVTSLGGTPVLTDEWGIDAVYSASQKCLSCTPGLSPDQLQRPRGRDGEEAQRKGAQLVHGHEPSARVLGCGQSHLSPHRADQCAVRAARSAPDAARGGPGKCMGAPSAQSRGAPGRPADARNRTTLSKSRTGCRR